MFENPRASVTFGPQKGAPVALREPLTPNRFIIQNETGKPLVTFTNDGTVTFGEGYTPDAAARSFWHAMAQRNPLRIFADCGAAFAEAFKGCQYGEEAKGNARWWFGAGWVAALARDAQDAARYRTIRAAVVGDAPAAAAHFMATDNPTSADEMDALVDAARGLPR